MEPNSFKIKVNEQEYLVTTNVVNGFKTVYKIETSCDYLFSIFYNEHGEWKIYDPDIKPIDNTLVSSIGDAIERKEQEKFMA